jgi:hypothetical protein
MHCRCALVSLLIHDEDALLMWRADVMMMMIELIMARPNVTMKKKLGMKTRVKMKRTKKN